MHVDAAGKRARAVDFELPPRSQVAKASKTCDAGGVERAPESPSARMSSEQRQALRDANAAREATRLANMSSERCGRSGTTSTSQQIALGAG